MPTEQKTIRIPVYTYGKYRAQDGTVEEFTAETMQEYVKNTNFVIQSGAFIPTVGYDHPVVGNKNTDAHGHIKGAVFENGVVKLDVLPIPDREGRLRLVEDRAAGRRPHVSGEHTHNFSFVDGGGKTVNVGRTILGLAALGSNRPAIKNPLMLQCSEVQFPDAVTAADAFMAREELRKSGLVSQTLEEGVLVFSEIKLSTDVDDTPKELPMTADEKAEMQRMMDAQAATLKAAFDAQLTTQINAVKAETANTIKAMSEGEAAKRKLLDRVAVVVKEKKLPPIPAAKLEEAVLDPTAERVLAFSEVLSSTVLPGPTPPKKEGESKADPTDEPAALAALRPKHFSDPIEFGEAIEAGLMAFGEYKPEALKGLENNPQGQLDRLRSYITTRDTAN